MCNIRDHNIALKWFREHCETCALDKFEYDLGGQPALVAPMTKPADGKPTDFKFTRNQFVGWTEWSPIWMLRNLCDPDRRLVIGGPEKQHNNRVVSIELRPTQPYCHKRHHVKKIKEQKKRWDFVIQRSDGTSCWLHPEYTKTTLSYGEIDPSRPPVVPPNKGLGRSDYKGQYQHKINQDRTDTLTFDVLDGQTKPKPNKSKTERQTEGLAGR